MLPSCPHLSNVRRPSPSRTRTSETSLCPFAGCTSPFLLACWSATVADEFEARGRNVLGLRFVAPVSRPGHFSESLEGQTLRWRPRAISQFRAHERQGSPVRDQVELIAHRVAESSSGASPPPFLNPSGSLLGRLRKIKQPSLQLWQRVPAALSLVDLGFVRGRWFYLGMWPRAARSFQPSKTDNTMSDLGARLRVC